jgi:hypothetical protein
MYLLISLAFIAGGVGVVNFINQARARRGLLKLADNPARHLLVDASLMDGSWQSRSRKAVDQVEELIIEGDETASRLEKAANQLK